MNTNRAWREFAIGLVLSMSLGAATDSLAAVSTPTAGQLPSRLATDNAPRQVSPGMAVSMDFPEPLDATSFNSDSVSVIGPNGPVPIEANLDVSGRHVTIKATQDWLPGARYTAFVSGARLVNGTPLPLATLAFDTRSVPVSSESAATAETSSAKSALNESGKEVLTGTPASRNALESPCDNTASIHGHTFCRKDGSVAGGIFIPGFNNTEGRWRLNAPLPALPNVKDFPSGTFPAGSTSVYGSIRRIDDKPIADATVTIGNQSVRTDAQGKFALVKVPEGHQILRVDGRTANKAQEEYGQISVAVDLKAGQANGVPFTMFVPRIAPQDKITLPSPVTENLVIRHPSIPGMTIQIPAGTVLRDREGKVITEFAVVPMPVDRSPMPVPANFPVYVSMQPDEAMLDTLDSESTTGIQVTYPNYNSETNKRERGFWYYDLGHADWVMYSTGQVSSDGKTVKPAPKTGSPIIMPQGGASIGGPDVPPTCHSGGAFAGDPVDCASGAFIHSRTDLTISDLPPLTFTRVYNSQDTVSRTFGRGMINSFAMYLHVPEGSCYGIYNPNGTEIDLITGDGTVYPFFLVSGATRNTGVLVHTATPTRFYGATMTTNNHYDVIVRLTDGTVYQISSGCPTQLQSMTDRFGNTFTLTYSAGLLSQVISSTGRSLSFAYNTNNFISAVSDNAGRKVSYTYNAAKQLSTVTYPDNTTEQYTYDAGGNMLTVKDRRGNTMVTNQYDENRRVSQQTYADNSTYQFAYTLSGGAVTATDVTNARGNVKHIVFDAAGYPISTTQAYGTALAQTTSYVRNAGELITSATDPLGRVTTMTYNSAGDVLTRTFLSGTASALTYNYTYTTDHQVATATDPLGRTVTFGYSGGCLSSIRDAIGNTTVISCNGAGQPISIQDALGHTTTLSYNGNDLRSVTDPLNRTTTFSTDSLGRAIAVQDPLGRLSRVTYDTNDRVVQSVDPLNQATSYSYDGNGNLTQVVDPNGGKTQFTYDARNRPTARTDALNQTESATYDNMGNLLTYTDRKGQQTNYQYDALGRTSKVTYADTNTVTPTYDAGGRLTQLVDSVSGTITYSYDAFDRVTQEQTPQGSINYTYDAIGRRATMTPGSQGQIAYTYDNADRLTQIRQGSETVSIAYDAANRRASLTLPNGIVTSYIYDAADQITGITYKTASGTTLSSLAYTYNSIGQRLSQVGGFLAEVLPTATTGSSAFDLNNRQTQWNGVVLGYDTNGDPAANASAGQSYTFDVRHRLTQIQNSGTGATLAMFAYDVFDRRISKTIGGTTTAFLYDGSNPVQETQGSANYSIFTGFGIDERYARSEAAGRYYFLTDALNSTLALTDNVASVQQRYAYEPYGEMQSSGTSTNPYQYTGRENDGTGLYYYRARYYSPTLKRFISGDPLGLAVGLNEYAYVDGNPVSSYDPYGLYSWDEFVDDSANFSAGWGDELTFGLTSVVRDFMNVGSVNKCSWAYSGGKVMGFANGIAIGWGLGSKTAAKAASPNNWANFSHSAFPNSFLKKFDNPVARWLNRTGNRANGDFLPASHIRPDLHDLMDATAARIGKVETWPLWRRLINRVPNVPGTVIYGAGSAAMNSCGCD